VARREGQIEALLAAGAGLLGALVVRLLLQRLYDGVHDGVHDHWHRLKLLDVSVLVAGAVVATVVYRLLRAQQRHHER
jgi:uncharacterized membrane protein YeaQ/YmgE (transglycosylase-associated protein family)